MAAFDFESLYRPISLHVFSNRFTTKQRVSIVALWVISLLVSVGAGVVSTEFEWFGLPLHFGGVDLFITIYPPLILCLLWVLWFGFWWGFIPAYLSTFMLALYTSGMPVLWSALFAFADPLGLALFALAYRAIPISYDLRSSTAVLFYILLAFVAGILGSSGSFIWTYTNATGIREVFPIWQGWWMGAFLQAVVINGPLLFFFTPAISRWKAAFSPRRQNGAPSRQRLMLFAGVMLVGVFCYFIVVRYFSILNLETALQAVRDEAVGGGIRSAFESLSATVWVSLVLILFITVFGYQVFSYWVTTLGRSARALKQANRQLLTEVEGRKRVQAELAASNATKDKFFSIIAHDMRGSLASFMGLSQLFVEETTESHTEEIQEMAALLNSSAENVYGFLENLLQWARMQTGSIPYEPALLDLRDVVDPTLDLLAGQAAQKEITLVNDVAQETRVFADENMVRSVLHNVVGNALKFTLTGGTVTLAARSVPDGVEVAVRDTGIGMAAEAVETLFKVDAKVSTPGTRGEAGSGLGLILCKEFVELNGGRLWLESTLGEGTTVRFIVPDKQAARPAPALDEDDPAALRPSRGPSWPRLQSV